VTDKERARSATRRLAIIRHAREVSGNVSQTCRYYGIARQSYYLWLRRYVEKGVPGLEDRSRRPHRSPQATSTEIVGEIVHLRQTYHFGPQKIAMYLKRYHELAVSTSGIWRILKRLGLSRLPASQRHVPYHKRWQRYEKPEPGHQVQIDVKFIAPLKGSRAKHYQFTAIDDCTRLRVLRVYERLSQKTAIQFIDYVLQKLPFRVERIQTDNGGEFAAAFHWHVQDLGIEHVYIRPRTPRLNGKVERSHRIDAEEFYRLLDGVVVDDAKVFTTKLQQWEDFYNFERPHGALGGQTPYERLRSKMKDPGVRGHRQLHKCGGGGIRTHGSLATSAVFKTAAFDRSATPPGQ
jgi:transposase InsO family protein/transposase-like protein